MTTTLSEPGLDPITIANRTFNSRLCVGTGKYASMDLMCEAPNVVDAEQLKELHVESTAEASV